MVCDAAPPAETAAAPCAITQMLVAAPGGPRVLQVSIRPAAAAGATPPGATGQPPGAGAAPVARLRLDLPLGLDLVAGVTLRIDGQPWTKVPVRTCLADGCIAGLLLAEDDVVRLKRGGRMGVVIQALDGRAIAWPVTLSGFTSAYDQLVARAP
jgi:invasion protein IalB